MTQKRHLRRPPRPCAGDRRAVARRRLATLPHALHAHSREASKIKPSPQRRGRGGRADWCWSLAVIDR